MNHQNEETVDYIKHHLAIGFYFDYCNPIYSTPVLMSMYNSLFRIWNEKRFTANPFPIFRDNIMAKSKIGSGKTYSQNICKLHEAGLICYSNYKNEDGKISREGILCTVIMRPLDKIYENWLKQAKNEEKYPPFPTQFDSILHANHSTKNTTQQKAGNEDGNKKNKETAPTEAELEKIAAEKNKQLIQFYASEILDMINIERTKMGIETAVPATDKEKKSSEKLLGLIAEGIDINDSESMGNCIKASIATWVSNTGTNDFYIKKFYPSCIESNYPHFSIKMKKGEIGIITNEKGIPISDSKGNRFPTNSSELLATYKKKYQHLPDNKGNNKQDKAACRSFMEHIGIHFDTIQNRWLLPKTD